MRFVVFVALHFTFFLHHNFIPQCFTVMFLTRQVLCNLFIVILGFGLVVLVSSFYFNEFFRVLQMIIVLGYNIVGMTKLSHSYFYFRKKRKGKKGWLPFVRSTND